MVMPGQGLYRLELTGGIADFLRFYWAQSSLPCNIPTGPLISNSPPSRASFAQAPERDPIPRAVPAYSVSRRSLVSSNFADWPVRLFDADRDWLIPNDWRDWIDWIGPKPD